MFHTLFQTYADAMYVATTLRPPVSSRSLWAGEGPADGEVSSPTRSSGPLAGRIAGWLRTRLGRRFAATGEPAAPAGPSFVRTPLC